MGDKKEKTVLVMVWDGRSGDFVRWYLYNNMTLKQALINGLNQFLGNFNTWTYPKVMDNIYESYLVKGRLIYDISDDVSIYAQRA